MSSLRRQLWRAYAILDRRHLHLLALTDQMARQRLLVWPEKEAKPDA